MKIDSAPVSTSPGSTTSNSAMETVKERFVAALKVASTQFADQSAAHVKSQQASLAAEKISDPAPNASGIPYRYNPVSATPLTTRPSSELAAIILGMPLVSAGGPGNTDYRCSDHVKDNAAARLAAWEAAGCPAVDADGNKIDNRGDKVTGIWG